MILPLYQSPKQDEHKSNAKSNKEEIFNPKILKGIATITIREGNQIP